VTTYEEWRVTGTFVNGYTNREGLYELTFTEEDKARSCLGFVRECEAWTDGPHLHKRAVTVTDWEEA
jgi:hypothetical protein